MGNAEIILECLRNHGPMTITKICARTGIADAAVRYSVKSLFEQNILSRNKNYTYTLNPSERPSESDEYLEAVKSATELEAKGLWLRASHNWLRAMLLAVFENNRYRAKLNRDKCESKARVRCGNYSGINSGKVSDYWQWEVNR
ncbi:PerC family transcriptional regulator [Pantoea ananatis]|uniref:PerC family transcriptional regulator n=1 Tax=Pantoea ananas TaxID=553 RepID=UPI001B3188E4|nr:PerC family transcriptional regulator [Pantoea ananatis]